MIRYPNFQTSVQVYCENFSFYRKIDPKNCLRALILNLTTNRGYSNESINTSNTDKIAEYARNSI